MAVTGHPTQATATGPGVEDLDARLAQVGHLHQPAVAAATAHAEAVRPQVQEALVLLQRSIQVLESLVGHQLVLPAPRAVHEGRRVRGDGDPRAAETLGWVRQVADALATYDTSAFAAAVQDVPGHLHPWVRDAAAAATTARWAETELLFAYVAGVCSRDGAGDAVRGVAPAAVAAARVVMQGPAPAGDADPEHRIVQAYLQCASEAPGGAALHQAAMSAYHRWHGSAGLAMEAALRAVALDPGLSRAHVELALSLAVEAAEGDPDEHHRSAAATAAGAPDPRAAMAGLVEPVPALALLAAARLPAMDSDPERAERLLVEALGVDGVPAAPPPEDECAALTLRAQGHELLARFRARRGDTEQAADDLVQAADAFLQREDHAQVESLLLRAVELVPRHAGAHLALADLYRYRAAIGEPDLLAVSLEHLARAEPAPEHLVRWRLRVAGLVHDVAATTWPADAEAHLWTALLLAEHTIALEPDQAGGYQGCANLEQRLGLYAAAWRDLGRTPPEQDTDAVLQARAVVAFNAGAYAHARSALVALAARPQVDAAAAWLAAAQELLALATGERPVATQALQAASAHLGTEAWMRQALARAYRDTGDHEAATAQTRLLWEERDALVGGDPGAVAAAGIRLGRFAEVLAVLPEPPGDPSQDTSLRVRLALARLGAGHHGVVQVLATIDAAVQPGELFGLEWDVETVAAALERAGRHDDAEALQGAVEALERGRSRPALLGDVTGELDRRLAVLPASGPGNREAGVCGVRSREAAESGDWGEATVGYQRLAVLGHRDLAVAGLRRVAQDACLAAEGSLVTHAVFGGDEGDGGSVAAAAVAHAAGTVRALEAAGQTGEVTPGDQALARRAGAVAALAESLVRSAPGSALQRLAASPHGADALADVVLTLVPQEAWWAALQALSDAAAGQVIEGRPSEDVGALVDTVRDAVTARLDLQGATEDEPVETRPLLVEIGDGLVAEDTGPGWKLFTQDIPALRRDVERQLGIRLPGVRVRSSPELTAFEWQVLLHGSVEHLGSLGRDPLTGAPPGPERLEPLMAEVLSTVRAHPTALLTVEGAGNLLRGMVSMAGPRLDVAARLLDLLARPERQHRLEELVHRLLLDGVHLRDLSVKALEVLLSVDVVSSSGELRVPLLDVDDTVLAAEALRPRLRSRLLGNAPEAVRFRLPATLVERLEGLVGEGDRVVLGQELARVAQVVSRRAAASRTRRGALPVAAVVVATPEQRRPLQDAVRGAGVDLVVLAEDEADQPVHPWPELAEA